ncbi:MAG TPA: orotidine-5'-phosphate decarboxylase [Gemmatimonadales bacterium]|nr:orotidine-5'-phosphate decarboxylase [Gemmatimonadales bacterium]
MAEVILALDVPGAEDALRLAGLPGLRWVKVGSILFTREGPPLVRELRARGLEVFLDLKWHDIPNTVAGAVERAAELDVAMATVHTLGGSTMLRAAVAASAAAGRPGLVGVTVLTSHSAPEYGDAVGRETLLGAEAVRLARLGAAAGLRGLVCSPLEVAEVRAAVGEGAWLVVPGIRDAGDAGDDQTRTATAGAAARAGATHLVVGRPVLRAADPGGALRRLTEEAARAPGPVGRA